MLDYQKYRNVFILNKDNENILKALEIELRNTEKDLDNKIKTLSVAHVINENNNLKNEILKNYGKLMFINEFKEIIKNILKKDF